MPDFKFPGVYVEEINPGMRHIEGVSTTTAAFVGFAENGPLTPTPVASFNEYKAAFGDFPSNAYLPYAVQGFFQNGGVRCYVLRITTHVPILKGPKLKPSSLPKASVNAARAAAPNLTLATPVDAANVLAALDALNDVSIVCCPDEHAIPGMPAALVAHCESRRDRIAILAAPVHADISDYRWPLPDEIQSSFAAYYLPWVLVANSTDGAALTVHPGGHVAGVYVRIDNHRGVWKAPAGVEASLLGILGLERNITDMDNGTLNPIGINALRTSPVSGAVVWGSRTTERVDSEWKYVSIKRYFIYLEQSIEQGLQWVVFEPNNETLWSIVRNSIGAFLFNEFRKGAMAGNKPDDAFFVKCDRSTMTQDDIDTGRLICLVGAALLKPAEFIVFQISTFTALTPKP